jgi:hypothetical protein
VEVNQWLEHSLQSGLQEVAAPPELWDRVRGAKAVSSRENNRTLVWAMAAAVVVMAVGLSVIHRDNVAYPQFASDHCQNPAQLRAWVKANTGFNVPLRDSLSPSIQLIGARTVSGRAEVAYRAGNRDGVLLVSRADGSANMPHSRGGGQVSSWVMDGQRFTLACADPAALQLACKLCHLD